MKTISPRIYTKCPACQNDTLTINHDNHLLCTWHECPNPTLIDHLPERLGIADCLPRVDSEPGKVTRYKPQSEPLSPTDLEAAKDAVLQIVDAFTANFQNTETDLARLITDRFTLRTDIPNISAKQS